jgi:hypothetical protein
MAYGDIQRLRQQYIFQPTEDISGGDMGYGPSMDYGEAPPEYGGGYNDTSQNPFDRPPTSMPAEASSGQAGMGAPPPVAPPQVPGGSSLQETLDAINRVYTPENVDRDRLRKLMDAAPERQAPSFGRALVAGGLSLKAQDPIATAEKVLYAPHYRNMADWTAKVDPYYKTAELENRANINERTLAGNVVTAQTQADRIASQEKIAAEKNRVAEIRARALDFKARGYEIKVLGDEVVGFSPDGKRISLGSSGGMDEADKIRLEGKYKVEAAEASGKSALDRITAAGGQIVVMPDGSLRVINPRTVPPTNTPVPGSTPGAPPTKLGGAPKENILDKRRRENDTLQTIYQTDPGNRKYITKKTDGTYTFKNRPVVTPESGWGWWHTDQVTEADVKAYDDLRKEVDPSYVPPKPGGIGGSLGSGKEETQKSSGIGPSTGPTTPRPMMGTGYGGYTPPSEEAPPISNSERQQAIGYLMQHGVDNPTEAQIVGAVTSGNYANEDTIKYKYQKNGNNPNEIRRTPDGQNFEYSHDGGKTWGRR